MMAPITGSAFLRCSMALRILKQSRGGIRHHFIGMRFLASAGLCATLLVLPLLPQQQQKAAEDVPPPIKVDVDIVNILASVRNKQNGLVANLNKEDFTLFEEGQKQTIKYFTKETDLPLTIGLLVDVSGRSVSL